MVMIKTFVGVAAYAATLIFSTPGDALVLQAEQINEQCGACHQMQGPGSTSLSERSARKAPPLFYAGNKFREEWLVNWLQNPVRIRPAGDFHLPLIKATAEGDFIDESKLADHMTLGEADAIQTAEYLMSLTPNNDLIAAENYVPKRVSKRMGTMDFVRFKGCAACHRDTPKYGGLSGPELHTAWQRLQPEFIVSYIRNPMLWEPRSLMPVKNLATPSIEKLANYLMTIGEE